jgi:hypothetical protein
LSAHYSKLFLKKRYLALFIILVFIIIFISDLLSIRNNNVKKSLPQKEINSYVDDIYLELANDSAKINWQLLNNDLTYISEPYDVSDFHVSTLVRIINDYPGKVPPAVMNNIKNALLKFRYWMDEPGENGMCYWSENHQILFASSEYLIGQLYPNVIFPNSGLTGAQHMQKARKRILDWLEMRWKFGFTEFYSNVYYSEDILGLINLIDYSGDSNITKKAEIIMDLLLYDIASQKTGSMFVSVSGRAYERSRKGGDDISSKRITDYIWKNIRPVTSHLNFALMTSKKYHIPQVIREIGNDKLDAVIKQCNGLNISQLKTEGYFGSDDKSIMMQWAMEAFSNPEIIKNSLAYIRKNNMFSNEFLSPFKYFDFTVVRLLCLEPAISSIFNPQTNGAAIQQANTYTYRTRDYSLYSVQNYFPGNYANQVHVAGMNIDSSFSIFHSHPASPKYVSKPTPNYWVGYGRLPHVAQDSSISLSIYNLPEKKNALEAYMLNFTHAYFPKKKFDSVIIINKYAFGKKGNTFCALVGNSNLYYEKNSDDDLIQPGRKSFWIIEAGNKKSNGSFNNFVRRILNNKIRFDSDNLILTYSSNHKELKLKFCGDFAINGRKINTNYNRFDSPYVNAKFKPERVEFSFNKRHLLLDFNNCIREFN